MQLTVKGRHLDTGDAFRRHAEDSLSAIFGKYLGDAREANATSSREAHLYRAQIHAHVRQVLPTREARGAPDGARWRSRPRNVTRTQAAMTQPSRWWSELEMEVPELTVHDAVMRLDAGEPPALMFGNRTHGGLNMLYRRPDGHLGWIDPRGHRATS